MKVLWMHAIQAYHTWRSNLLYRLGFCYHCGWKQAQEKGVCFDCLDSYLPTCPEGREE